MNKKILVLTLCFTIVFSSLNIKRSYANPLVLTKVAEVSVIYSIGRLAFDTVGFVGAIADIMDLGGSIYSKMSDKEKDDYKNSVKFEDDKFTYSDNSYSNISSHVPSNSKGFHLMTGVTRTISPKVYISNINQAPTNEIFEQNKQTFDFQGTKYDYLLYSHSYNSTIDQYYFYIKKSSDSLNNLKKYNARYKKDSDTYFNFYISQLYSNGVGVLNMDWKYKYDNLETTQMISNVYYDIPNICDNCPHDFSLGVKDSYRYPTSSELQYVEENYPQYENDIKVPADMIPPNADNNGDNNGDNNINSPIINNPPSFPNLQEFDFSGLKLEPLTNLFSNFKSKFPFSLPFDLVNLISGLKQDPIPPRFEIEILSYNFVLDFTQFEMLAQIIRGFTLLSYVVSLIFITKRFGG